MVALITGANGFVGKHLKSILEVNGDIVFGCDLTQNENDKIFLCDLLDFDGICRMLSNVRPDFIYHLAGQSNVAFSWKNPELTLKINAVGTLNLLEAVRKCGIKCRVLLIGSSEQYGIVAKEAIPIDENYPLNSHNPYSISKTTAEMYGRLYVNTFGVDVVMARAFNHIGPGQSKGFVISDFASKIADIEKGLSEPVLNIGNIEAIRDFTDVRDIVEGYRLLMQMGKRGEVYNIGSGKGTKISEIIDIMLAMSTKTIKMKIDPEKIRPSDMPVMICDNTKIKNHTSWQNKISLFESIKNVLEYWRTFDEFANKGIN